MALFRLLKRAYHASAAHSPNIGCGALDEWAACIEGRVLLGARCALWLFWRGRFLRGILLCRFWRGFHLDLFSWGLGGSAAKSSGRVEFIGTVLARDTIPLLAVLLFHEDDEEGGVQQKEEAAGKSRRRYQYI
eukprot:4964046-Ditylum_brightwellii.AAC.1